jgi:hypothetical protein
MDGQKSNIDLLTLFALPAILAIGWIIYLSWIIGFEVKLILLIFIVLIIISLIYLSKKIVWNYADIRWLIAPLCVFILAEQLPWWQMNHVGLTDGMYHLIQANHYIGEIENIPLQQNQDFLFRPPILPAVLSIEVLITGSESSVTYAPLILLICTCWQLQHLSERWNNKLVSAMIVPAMILIPVFRYWGQLPYADIPVAGLWIFLIHLTIIDPKSRKSVMLLGSITGLIFLTKYVFIYALGLVGWLLIKDKSYDRALYFLQGWLIVTTPFLIFHLITQGDPLAALSPQTNYAIESATSVVGMHNSSIWWQHFVSQVSIYAVIGLFIGSYRLCKEFGNEMLEVVVLLLPLLVLHIFVLDFGTERYHTPWIALTLCICAAGLSLIQFPKNINSHFKLPNNLVCALIIMLIITTNYSTVDKEIEDSENYISLRQQLFDFHLDNVNNLPENSILLTGHDIPIILNLDIEAYRFINHENPIEESILRYEATHIVTSNWNPRYQWEKDTIKLLGNPEIEPISVNLYGNKVGVLWEINNSTGASPSLLTTANESNIFGDLLLLYQNQSVSITSHSANVTWVEVNEETSLQDILLILTDGPSNVINACYDENNKLSSCEMIEGEILSSNSNSMIFAWFDK